MTGDRLGFNAGDQVARPRFDRNDNTNEPSASATRMLKASQTVFHDGARPSALLLPIVPR